MRRDGFSPPASWFIDCLKGKSGPFRFPRSFAGAEMGPGEEKPAGHTACMAKGFDEAWAHFCPSKPCLPLSIDVIFFVFYEQFLN